MRHPSRLIPTILLCVGAALPLSAHADLYGTATLDISRIALTRADGTPFTTADFAQSAVRYRDGLDVWIASKQESKGGDTFSPQMTDLSVSCVGAACPITGENNFEPLSVTPTGAFANADQRQSGGLLTNDLRMQQRGDAGVDGQGAGSSAVQFEFRLSRPGSMTIELDATPFATAWRPDGSGQPDGSVEIGTYLNIVIFNLTSSQFVINHSPPEMPRVWNPGTEDPGLLTFTLDSGPLNANDTYRLSIYATAFAWVTNPVPEPSSFAMFGVGLVVLLLLRRRRKAALPESGLPACAQ